MSTDGLLWNYIFWLFILSVLVTIFEVLWPAREQNKIRKWLWSDYIYLVFNGHLLGPLLYAITSYHIVPHLDILLAKYGLKEILYFNAVESWGWGLILQSFFGLLILDFVQWLVHNTLHRVSFLWEIHKVHHSVKDGEMDWIVSFRFSWLEPVIYKIAMYTPAMWFGFAPEALFFHAVFGTLIGHLNHANLNWDYGPFRYIFNSPRMHLYHHAYDAPAPGQNFGIILSCWDWLFGTCHLPDEPCPKIGFPGVDDLPNDFFGQVAWPLPQFVKVFGKGTRPMTSIIGILILLILYGVSLVSTSSSDTLSLNESTPSLQTVGQTKVRLYTETTEYFFQVSACIDLESMSGDWLHRAYKTNTQEPTSILAKPLLEIFDSPTGDDRNKRLVYERISSLQQMTQSDYFDEHSLARSLDKMTLQKILRTKEVQQRTKVSTTEFSGSKHDYLW